MGTSLTPTVTALNNNNSNLIQLTPTSTVAVTDYSVTIDAITGDDSIDVTEASQNIVIAGQVSGNYVAVLSVNLIVNGTTYAATINSDGSYQTSIPGADLITGTSIKVEAVVGDQFEETHTVTAERNYVVDTIQPPVSPTVIITEDSNDDGVIDANELQGHVDYLVTVPEGAKVDDVLYVEVYHGEYDAISATQLSVTITQDIINNGYIGTVANSDYIVDPGFVRVEAYIKDQEDRVSDRATDLANFDATPIDPCEDPGVDAAPQFLWHLGANLTATQGPSDHHGKTGGKYGDAISYTTSESNDAIYIGYEGFDVAGALIESCWDGDFERDSEDGNVLWNLETYAGNDLVHIREDQNAYTSAKLGSGNDIYYVQGEMDSVLGLAQSNLEARSYIYTEECHDTVVIGGNGDGIVTGWGIDGGRIFTGSGNDKVVVYGEMDDGGVIDLGAGRIEFALDEQAAASVDNATNTNYVTISKNLGNAGLYDFGHVFGGAGNDNVTVGTFVEGASVIDLGEGTNNVTIGDDLDGQAKVITGSGDDTLVIGDDTEDYSSINLGDGNNSISIASTVEDHSVIKTGNGDDTLTVGYAIANYADVNLGDGNNTINVADDIDGYSGVRTGSGDDVLNIGDDTEDGSVVDLGDGNNSITIASNVEDRSSIRVGNGNDTINVATSMLNSSEIRLGEGNNTLTFGDSIIGATKITAGAGDDVLKVGYKTDGTAMIDLGAGNNTITTGDDVDGYTKLTTGDGNDILTIGDDTEDYAVINLGNGDNVIHVADALEDRSSIITGAGNDTLTVGGSTWNSATAELGAGDDVVTISGNMYGASSIHLGAGDDVMTVAGKTLTGSIAGGAGHDTLVLDYTLDSSAVDCNLHITNATTQHITGIEMIELAGQNALDVRFEDLLADTGRDGALFIQGDSSSKVDLGSTNWNSDGVEKAQMRDATTDGTWSKFSSSEVDGVSYDIYHNSAASNAANDVYIEQGIVVI